MSMSDFTVNVTEGGSINNEPSVMVSLDHIPTGRGYVVLYAKKKATVSDIVGQYETIEALLNKDATV